MSFVSSEGVPPSPRHVLGQSLSPSAAVPPFTTMRQLPPLVPPATLQQEPVALLQQGLPTRQDIRAYLEQGLYRIPRRMERRRFFTPAQVMRSRERRARALEQYYTPTETVRRLTRQFLATPDLQFNTQCQALIDPAYGSGRFLLGTIRETATDPQQQQAELSAWRGRTAILNPPTLAMGIDVDPRPVQVDPDLRARTLLVLLHGNFLAMNREDIVNQLQALGVPTDYIYYMQNSQQTCTIGVPPFSLAVRFFERASTMSDHIAMLFPAGFSKERHLSRLNPEFELVSVYPFRGTFEILNRTEEYPGIFQVWRRRNMALQGPRPSFPVHRRSGDVRIAKYEDLTDLDRVIVISNGQPDIMVESFHDYPYEITTSRNAHLLQVNPQFDNAQFDTIVQDMRTYFDEFRGYFLSSVDGRKVYTITQNDIYRAYDFVPPAPLELIALQHEPLILTIDSTPLGMPWYDATVHDFMRRYVPLHMESFVEYLKAIHHPRWLAALVRYMLTLPAATAPIVATTAGYIISQEQVLQQQRLAEQHWLALHDALVRYTNLAEIVPFTIAFLYETSPFFVEELVESHPVPWRAHVEQYLQRRYHTEEQTLPSQAMLLPPPQLQPLSPTTIPQSPVPAAIVIKEQRDQEQLIPFPLDLDVDEMEEVSE